MWRSLKRLLAPLSLVVVLGCGDNGGNYEISGTVTWDGKPIPKGFITFIPDKDKGNSGPGGGAEIVDGKYRTAKGKGIIGGPYIVKIVGYDGIPYKEGGEEVTTGKALFHEYEIAVEFPKESTTKDFTVPKNVPPPKKKITPGDDRDGY
jgi:hypothetical protein